MNLQKQIVQDKIVNVNDRIGNDFIKQMQGTTKMVYDTLPIDGRNVYEFFKDTNTRSFPDTNVKANGLPVAESLACQRFSFSIIRKDNASGAITAIIPLSAATTSELPLNLCDLDVKIANDTVMRPITIQHFMPEYNKTAINTDLNTFELNTNLVIPPQLNFEFNLRAPVHASNAPTGFNDSLRCIVEGVGSQFNGKTNF